MSEPEPTWREEESLLLKRIVKTEFDKLIRVATTGACEVTAMISLSSPKPFVVDVAELGDLYDREKIKYLVLNVVEYDGSRMQATLIGPSPEIKATGGTAATRKHRVSTRYAQFPERRRLLSAVRIALFAALALATVGVSLLVVPVLALLGDGSVLNGTLAPLQWTLLLILAYLIGKRVRRLVPDRTLVVQGQPPWYKNPVLLAVISLTAALATLTTAIITLIARS